LIIIVAGIYSNLHHHFSIITTTTVVAEITTTSPESLQITTTIVVAVITVTIITVVIITANRRRHHCRNYGRKTKTGAIVFKTETEEYNTGSKIDFLQQLFYFSFSSTTVKN
jgi:preprotein translocase subunit SecY